MTTVTTVSAHVVSAVPMLAAGVIALAFAGYCERDLVRADGVRHLPKWLWAIICCGSIPLGGILYLSFGRTRR